MRTALILGFVILSLCSLLAVDISAQQTKPAKKADPVIEALKNTAWKGGENADTFLVLSFNANGGGEISWRTTLFPDQPLGGRADTFQSIEKQGKTYSILANTPPQPGITYTPTRWVLEPSADKQQLTVKRANKKYSLAKQERNG
jgi:hypothetical protein